MEIFVWDERYLTGQPMIDAEHHGLVALINKIATLQARGSVPAEIRQVVDELIDYAAVHFAHEEALMHRGHCDLRHVEAHQSIHRNFARQVSEMREQASLDLEYLMRFLSSWLAFHILGIDQSLTRQLRAIQGGASPAQAFEADHKFVTDPAAASLLQAMHSLYGVITLHNDQLRGFNDTLEATVRARTADLEARNTELAGVNARLSAMSQQLLQAEKLASLGQLAAGVAHEINNPISFVLSNLGVVEGYLNTLLSLQDAWAHSGPLPAEVKALADKADLPFMREDAPGLVRESRDGLERVRKIVQDLRDFSQIDGNQAWGWNDLQACLEQSLGVLGEAAFDKVELLRDCSPLAPVWSCVPLINQVLASLMRNALEAMPAGGRLSLSCGLDGEHAWLEIADTGCGIAPEALPKIFDPFYSSKPIGSGTGMGLAQAYGIVQQHRGRIEVKSEPGQGSAFRVWLPLGPPAEG
jgi:two-component system NtrC family sensor kinase